jgi:hypothetical protein
MVKACDETEAVHEAALAAAPVDEVTGETYEPEVQLTH